MKFLRPGIDLKSVITSDGKDGRQYYVKGDDQEDAARIGTATGRIYPCERIIVVQENGSLAPIPFAVCVDVDGTLRLVNLTSASEVELMDKAVDESDIVLPPGVLPGPGHPGFEKPN